MRWVRLSLLRQLRWSFPAAEKIRREGNPLLWEVCGICMDYHGFRFNRVVKFSRVTSFVFRGLLSLIASLSKSFLLVDPGCHKRSEHQTGCHFVQVQKRVAEAHGGRRTSGYSSRGEACGTRHDARGFPVGRLSWHCAGHFWNRTR